MELEASGGVECDGGAVRTARTYEAYCEQQRKR